MHMIVVVCLGQSGLLGLSELAALEGVNYLSTVHRMIRGDDVI